MTAVAFDGEGEVIATGGEEDTTVRLWNAATAAPIGQPFTGHENAIRRLVFSIDGTHVVSSSRDNTVRVWHIQTGQMVGLPFADQHTEMKDLAFNPDGSRLIAAGSNSVYFWDADVTSWVRRACALTNRNLSITEWRKYMGDAPYRRTCPDLPDPPTPGQR